MSPSSLVPRVLGVLAAVGIGGLLLSACSGPAPESTGKSPDVDVGTRIYFVQLQLTEDKDRATETLGRAEQWWNQQPPADRPPLAQDRSSDKPTEIVWKAPLYRVRLGPFATEAQAEAVLDAARPTFPDAFVAPDRPEATPQER